ncbi:VCBS domain-containing protein [Zoogloea sp. 1C4]|uniref:VCBS domain-containing protein n=1 Tax=Zoogloea sp. 1C4 TaxID=2570190 RepID=UPI0012911016|nr:VCBS domain-containing protein [Zoogloea sp. 1C4]
MATPSAPINATTNATAKGTVVFVQGEAFLRDAAGKLTAIKPGDPVGEGQVIVTGPDSVVELQLATGAKVSVGADRELLLNDDFFATTVPERSENVISSQGAEADKIIQALNSGKDPFEGIEDPAAGLAGGGLGDQTHDFVRLVRVLEEVTPLAFAYSSTSDGIDFLPLNAGAATPTTTTIANNPPVATPDPAVSATEDTPVSFPVLGNDTDADGDPLTVTGATASNGTVTVNPDGSLSYKPNPDFHGTDTVTYTISDGKGGTATTTVTINVAPVNDPPVAVADTATTREDTPVTVAVLGNDTDVDGDTLTVTGATVDPAKGSVTVNPDGTLTFTPATNVNGPVTITYTIDDGKGGTTTATATVNIAPVNDPATVSAGAGSVKEDTPAQSTTSGTLAITDPDAGEAAFQPQTNTAGTYGSFTIAADGAWSYTLDNTKPNVQALKEGETRTETFTVQSIDGTPTTVTISVVGTNDGPVANPDTAATNEDTPITFAVLGNDTDPDGDPLTVTGATVDPAKGTVTVNPDGTLTFNPAANINGPVTITYTIADGKGGGTTGIATINVAPQPDNAVLGTGAGTVKEDTPAQTTASGTLTITDPDAGEAAFQPQTNVAGTYGSFSVAATGAWSYAIDNTKPNVQALKEGETHTETFTVQSIDGTPTTVTITVVGTNDGPVANPDTAATNEDTPVTFAVLGNDTDPDGDPLTVTGATVDPAKGTVTVNPDGTLSFTPAANVNGPVTVTYTIADGKGGTTTGIATINVAPQPDNAVLGTGAGTVKEDTPAQTTASGTLTITDPDAGEAAFQPQTNVAGAYGSFNVAASGAWTYAIDNTKPVVQALKEGETHTEIFSVQSIDGTPTTVTITVVGTNDGPVANPDTASTNEDTPVTFAVLGNDTDPDGDTLTVTGATVDPTKGTVVVNPDGTLSFTPAANVNGPVTVTYTITDGKGGTTTATATVNIAPLNDDPLARNDVNGLVKTDSLPATGNVITNPAGIDTDVDGDTLTVTTVAGAPVSGATVITGLFGTLTIQADGQYSYIQDTTNPAVTGLVPGATLQDSFAYTVEDGHGGSANAVLTINIAGANTPPVASPDTASTDEDKPVTFAVLGNDTDPEGDALTVTGATVDPTKGTVTVNPDGTLSFTPATNVNGPVTITYTIADGKGGTTTGTATVNIAPQPDSATLGTGSGTVKEDTPAQSSASGTLTITDPDAGESTFKPQTSVAGSYGSFSIATNGAWTYDIDNTRPNVQALKEGETKTETFTVQSADGTPTTVTITVVGTNDGPVAQPDTATTEEDKPVTFAVLGNDTDPDSDPLTVTGASVDPTKGSVTVNPDGTLSFSPAANVNGPVTVTYTISDGHGGTTTGTATINVTPLPDNAVMSAGTGTVKEDTPAQSSASGTLTITDPDAGEAAFQPQTNVAGTYGTFSVAANGAWTYDIDNTRPTVQALKEGETRTETLTVQSVDGTPTTVTITVVGTNDGPVANPDTASTNEDVPVTFAVLGNDSDPDGDTLTVTGATVDPAKGTVTVNPDGTLRFVPANNVNGPVTVTYTIADGHGGTTTGTATINVAPVNDPATISSGVGSVQEDTTLIAKGVLTITDPDAGESAFQAQTGTPGTFGAFSIDASGNWTYTLDNGNPVVQALATGDSRTETFTVRGVDGTPSTVVVTILGTNEVIGAPGLGVVKEDNPITADGKLTASGGASFVPQPATPGTYGSLTLNPDGSWTYTLNNASNLVQSLGDGQTRIETFPVALSDGTTSTITITVVGTNDPAIVTPGLGTVVEDTQLTTGGTLVMTDADAGETGFRPQPVVAGLYGVFALDTAGNWTYTLNNANPTVQALGVGETLTETFPVATLDGTPSTVTVTIQGTNDGPIALPDTAATNEDVPVTFAVLGNDSDPDGDTVTVTGATVDPTKGTVVVNPDGTLTFNPAANVNGPVAITYTIADGHGGTTTATATVNIAPIADPAILGTGTGTVKEDTPAQTSASGTLSIVDPDAGQAAFQPQTNTAGTYGSFSVAASGAWTYAIDNTKPVVQALKEGETKTETFTVQSIDGTPTTVTINVVGTNDGPVANPDTASTNEDVPVTFAVLGNDSDPDGDTLTVTGATVDPTKGTVTVNPDGTLSFTPAANVNGPVTITYTIADGHGGTTTATATVNIAPIADPAILGTGTGTVKEDTPAQTTASGTLSIIDPDAGQAAFQPQTNVAGTYGTFSVATTGAWTYTVDNTKPVVQALKEGESKTETFTVQSIDGTPTTVTINVVGTNDGPVANPDTASTNEDVPVTFAVLGNDSDPDGDTLTVTGATVDPTKGTVSVNPDGTLSFTPAANVNGPVAITYTIADGHGGTTTATATVNIAPIADPAILGTGTGTVKEDTPAQTTATGTLSIVDPDAGQAAFQPQTNVAGTYGTFSVATTGAWTYTVDNTKPVVQALKEGETRTETFTVQSIDGTTTTVTINVVGTNDGPVANPDTASTNEDVPVTFAVLGNDSDPDGDSLTVTGATVDPTKGTVTVNPDGTLTFNPAANVNGPVTITYTISDGHGGTTTATATVNIAPIADPAILGTGTGTVKEDTPAQTTASGTLSIVDPDAGQAAFQPQTNVAGTYGTFSVATTGAWTYTVDNTKPVVQALKEGETRTETFTVQSIDGTPTTVTINVVGTNDGPVANNDTATTKEDTPVTFAVLGNDGDPDGDTLTVIGATVDPSLGTVVVNPDGTLTLTFKPAIDYNGPVEIQYTISDGHGGTATAIATVTVEPMPDTAILGTGAGTVQEDTPAQTTATGTLTIIDPDAGEAVFQPQTNVAGTYGTFSVGTGGAWIYTIDNSLPAVQALKETDSKLEVFTVKSADGTETTVTITVKGTNDGPVAQPDTATTNEDTPVTFAVLGNDSDPDGDTVTVTGATVDPTKGTVTVNPDGTLTFNPAANVNGPVTVTYTISDGHGGTTTGTATVNVAPQPDNAVLGTGTGTVKEDTPAQTTATGTLSIVDPDAGQAAFQPQTNVAGTYGTFSVATTGAWTYTVDNTKPIVQALKEGETKTETFTVQSIDGTTTTVTINVVGTNDGPVANPNTASTSEDVPVTFAVLGNDTDPDGDTLVVTGASVDPAKGTVTVNPDGTLTFTPATNVSGQVVISYTISDGHGGTSSSTATILVAAVNDAPVALADTNTTTEDTPITSTAPGVLANDTDPDSPTLTVTGALVGTTGTFSAVSGAGLTLAGTYGTLVIHTDGSYTYTPGAAAQALNTGTTVQDVFSYRASDGALTSTATLTINVTGANDAAQINGPLAGSVKEDTAGQLVASNSLFVTDVDNPAAFNPATVTGTYGSFSINAAGDWTYTLNNSAPNVQALKEGDTRVETFTVSTVDGTTRAITIDVLGTNERPAVTAASATGSEDPAAPIAISLGGADVDGTVTQLTIADLPAHGTLYRDAAMTQPIAAGATLSGATGTVYFKPDANWNGNTSFHYTATDNNGGVSTQGTASIGVTAVNDAPVAANDVGSVLEDGTLTVTAANGLITSTANPAGTDTDVDSASLTVTQIRTGAEAATGTAGTIGTALAGTYGTLTLQGDGSYVYIANKAAALAAGVTATDVFTYRVSDGSLSDTAELRITVTGTNDTPVTVGTLPNVSGVDASGVSIPTASGFSDPDSGDVLHYTATNLPAGLTIDPTTGVITGTLGAGASQGGPYSIVVTATDGSGASVSQTFQLTVTNPAPTAAADTLAVSENLSAGGNVVTGVGIGGDRADSDPDGDTLTVTRIGTGTGTPATAVTAAGTSVVGAHGTLVIHTDGSYTYTATDNTLQAGEHATDVFSYTVSDGQGGTATTTLTVDVTGTNDAPVIGGTALGNVTEDGTQTASGTLTITDADAGQSGFVAKSIGGTYGSLTIDASGNWTYTLNNGAANVQGLKQGQQVVDRINVTTLDGTTREIAITVTGTNDAPVVGTGTATVSEEGLTNGASDNFGTSDTTNLTTAGGVISVSDVDGNTLTATLTPPPVDLTSGGMSISWTGAGTGTLIGSAGGVEIIRATIAADGTYTVKLSGPVDHPDKTTEDVRTINFGVNVSDGVTTTTSTLTVNVEDDAPIASAATQAIAVAPADTNLLIMLDTSASMTLKDGVGGTTRLSSAISALNTLLDSYDSFGEVRVRLVTFNSSAREIGSTWFTVAEAKAQLAKITATGGTNYDSAIAAGEAAFTTAGKLASGQNIAYFLSDGQPNLGTEIGTTDETGWKSYLQTNQITSFALGMGVAAIQSYLDPIAYNGVTRTNLDGQVISDFNQLSSALQATVPTPAAGEILSGGLLGGTSAFGADGGHIQSITVDGVTYTYNDSASGSITVTGGTSHGTFNTATQQLSVTTAAGGTLVVNMSSGSYTYTPIATVSNTIHDGFGFTLIDKDGDTAASTVDFNISRSAENVLTATATTSAIATGNLGLTGEFYGYNDTTSSTNTRVHADDTRYGNLDHISDMVGIIDGRSGQTIVGTYNAATAAGADATFSADKLDYGFGYTTGITTAGAVNGNLGNNPTQPGSNLAINSGALYNFLRGGTTGADTTELKTTTGIGYTTDSGLRMVGLVNLDGGSYDIRVTADDGFRLNIAGKTVAMFDDIQSPTTRVYSGVSLASGLQPIELLYWEQGGNARLRVEVKLSSEADTAYKTLGTDDFALFTPTSAPTLSALQDIIEDPSQNGRWLVRTGAQLDGSTGNDDITGTDGRDILTGGAGNDIIRGGAGADLISGGSGNDTLTGGLGSDTFKWSLGDAGTTAKPAVDAITDFDKGVTGSASSGGDILDLRDLLQGESHTGNATGNLGNYLHFEKSGADTVVHVSTNGGYTGGTFVAGATDQKIVLQGVDLTNSGALSTDAQIIQDLLTKGKLSAD